MKSFTHYLTMNIPSKMAFENITPQVAEAVKKSGVREGIALINSMHITSSVFVNDDERGLHHDFGVWLEQLAPFNPNTVRLSYNYGLGKGFLQGLDRPMLRPLLRELRHLSLHHSRVDSIATRLDPLLSHLP